MPTQDGYNNDELTFAQRNANTIMLSDGVRARKTNDGYVIEVLGSDGNWSNGNGGTRIIDLGMVSYRDAAIKGRGNILIPYADGRLIKSISFVPGGTLNPDGNEDVVFATPNTRTNYGFGLLSNSFGGGTDTVGLVVNNFNAGIGGYSDGSQILDCGPLATLYTIGSGWGLASGTWQANQPHCAGDLILDVNDHLQKVRTNGVTGSDLPTFATGGGNTNDGSVVWEDKGLAPTGGAHVIAEVIEGVTLMPPYPATLEWVTPPADSVAGQTMPTIVAIVKDQHGNPWTFLAETKCSLLILGAGTMTGDQATIDTATGLFTWSGASIAEAGTGYILRAVLDRTLITDPIYSPPFDVTAP